MLFLRISTSKRLGGKCATTLQLKILIAELHRNIACFLGFPNIPAQPLQHKLGQRGLQKGTLFITTAV